MKILIVDDSALIRRSITGVVKDAGYTPIEAENGAKAMTMLRKHGPMVSLIILDWNMPVMNGYEVLVKIKSTSEYKHIPVLMATSDGIQDNVVKAIKAGASAYLIKPFTPEILSKQIAECLETQKTVK